MKRYLLIVAAFALALSLQSSIASAGGRLDPGAYTQCFDENYGGGTCATTCVAYNDQGSVIGHLTALHKCPI